MRTPRWPRASTRCLMARVFSTSIPQNANPQNPTTAKPNEFLRPYIGYQNITIREHFGTGVVQLSSGAAQPPLHPRPAVRASLTPSGRPSPTARAVTARIQHAAAAAWNEGPTGIDATARPRPQLHLGCAERQQDVEQRADARLARRLAAVRRQRRSSVETGQAPARSTTTDNFDFTGGDVAARPNISGERDLQQRQLRPDALAERGATSTCRRSAARRTRRHRQRAGHVLPAAEDRAVQHVHLQELPAWRWQADSVPLGGLQRLQSGELVDPQHQHAIQSAGSAGQRELRPGRRPRARRESCRERFGSRSKPRTDEPETRPTTRATDNTENTEEHCNGPDGTISIVSVVFVAAVVRRSERCRIGASAKGPTE